MERLNIPKSIIALALCLPVAVILGYFLADPMQLDTVFVVGLVFLVLMTPLMMKWYYPILVFSWNAAIIPMFLPGHPPFWMLMTVIGLSFACLNRAVNSNARFQVVPSITRPLIFLAGVVIVTGITTGGVGLAMLGSSQYGGRKYLDLLIGMAGYFAFASQRIPLKRAHLYVGIFLLAGLTPALGNLVYAAGPKFYFLFDVLSPTSAIEQATGEMANYDIVRIAGLSWGAPAVCFFLLARYGFRGVLDVARPWRILLFAAACVASLFGGYRSGLLLLALTSIAMFMVEGLYRTKYVVMAGLGCLVAVMLLVAQSEHLPLVAQRTLSFIPGLKLDPLARQSADISSEWRIRMWKQVLPEVPQHFFHGKGYAIDARSLYLDTQSFTPVLGDNAAWAMLSGDYHNGPLSILIPFGVYGAIGFLWLVVAGIRLLYRNYQYGAPELKSVNGLLLAAFTARSLFFFVIFGGLSSDMAEFAGWLGLSVALNGGEASRATPAEHPEPIEFDPGYHSLPSHV